MPGKKRTAAQQKLPTRSELLYMIRSIDSLNPQRDRALIVMEYLTGARISELIKIKENQIIKENILGTEFIQIDNVKTLKRREDKYRTIIIPIEKERNFLQIMLDYHNTIRDKEPGGLLFPITRQRAWQIIYKYTGWYNHFFRHLRATHLTTIYGFSGQELKKYFDWASSRMADFYSHLNMEDIARKMGK